MHLRTRLWSDLGPDLLGALHQVCSKIATALAKLACTMLQYQEHLPLACLASRF